MKLASKMFALTALAASCSTAFALVDPAPVQLRVTAKMVPVSCDVTIDGNGVFNYPDISGGELNKTTPYWLGQLDKNFTINCPSAAAKVGFNVMDNQPTSAAWPKLDVDVLGAGTKAFGLGTAGGKKIGAYALWMDTYAVDGDIGWLLSTADPASGIWSSNAGATGLDNTLATTYNLAKINTGPQPHQNYTGVLHVQAVINSRDQLEGALDNNVTLSGSATINLVYL